MFISLDLETTGFNPEEDYIIEFGAVRFDLNGEKERLDFLVKSEKPIPEIVTYITKIKNSDLEGAKPFEEHIEEIKKFIGDLPIVGHNIEFDTNFLRAKGIPLTNPEYDTHTLAGMLLHNLPSYSLEVISQTLGLQHEDKHRALDDAIAAMELFIELTKRFQALPATVIDRIHTLCQKSDWATKDLLLTLNHQAQDFPPLVITEELNEGKSHASTILEKSESAIFEDIPPYNKLAIDLATKSSPDTYISVPYHLFRQIEAHIPDNVAHIDKFSNYISESRLEKFLAKEHFDNDEISAATKYLTWLEQTKTGLLSEIRIFGNEKKTLPQVNVDESISQPLEERFIKQALSKDQENGSICSHEYLLEALPDKHSNLVIIDLEQFKHNLHRQLSIYLSAETVSRPLELLKSLHPTNPTIESLKSKTATLFALIESLFDQFNDKNEYSPRCNITQNIRANQSWQNAAETVKGLIEISQELVEISNEESRSYLQKWKEQLKNLHEVFAGDHVKASTLWIERNYRDQQVCLRKIPSSVEKEMREILGKYQSYKIIDENPQIQKEMPELPYHQLFNKRENLTIKLVKNQLSDPALMEFFTQEAEQNPGNSALIFNSKKQLMDYTLGLYANGVNIISQLTSSTGKLKAQLKEFHNEAFALMTPGVWENIDHQKHINTLYIHKIPFEPPSKPEIMIASEGNHNSFMEVQIPAALLGLKRIINRLDSDDPSQQKTVVIFDARIATRSYGKEFIAMLREIGEVEIVESDQL